MLPLITPSPPPHKEPPDKYLRDGKASPLPRPTIITSTFNDNEVLQEAPASPTMRPPFAPFFTLITDNNTNATYHPQNVHYIFSDDDPSLLTSAYLDIISPHNQASRLQNLPHQRGTSLNSSGATSQSRSPSDSTTAAGQRIDARQGPGVGREKEDRILLLDLDSSGQNVTRAQSLSSSWQILSTTLHPAPTWADSPSDPETGEGGDPNPSPNLPRLMLKISGTDGTYVTKADGAEKGKGHGLGSGSAGDIGGRGKGREREVEAAGEVTEGDFRGWLRQFEERMRVLRRVVEAGEEGSVPGNEKID